MPNYPPSPFEAAVAGFLGTYGASKDRQKQSAELALRKRQADTADQEATVRLANEGYSRITMPTIQAPPDQSFASRVGSFLHGGLDQPSSIVMKTGPSSADEAATRNEAFVTSRDVTSQANARELESMRAAIAANAQAADDRRAAAAQTGENTRAAAAQAGENYRAGLYRATSKAALGQTAKHSVVDDAIDATGGYAERAWNSIPDNVKKQYGITVTDMNAGTQRFTDRKAQLTREGIAGQNERAAAKGGGFLAPPGVKPPPPVSSAVAPTAGDPRGAASAPIPGPRSPRAAPLQPLADSDKQAATQDPAFAAHLASLGYVRGRDF
jgi:hypothetical protein